VFLLVINFEVKFRYYEPIDGYDHLCMFFLHNCVLLLVVFWVLFMSVIGGVGCVFMCSVVVD